MNRNESVQPLKEPVSKGNRDLGYDVIRFFATMQIVIWHFYTTCREQGYPMLGLGRRVIDYNSLAFGFVGVALFFLLSGAVSQLPEKNDMSLVDFYKKKFFRIMFPQWIAFLAAFLVVSLVCPWILKIKFWDFVVSFMGLNYAGEPWTKIGITPIWIIGEWFTAVIIVLYLLAPLLQWMFAKSKWISTIVVSAIFFLNLKYQVLTYYQGWFSISNGLMCYWTGMLFQHYKAYFQNRYILMICFILLFLCGCFFSDMIWGYSYLSTFVFSILLFNLLYTIRISTSFIRYISRYGYEVYLIHHRIYILFLPVLLKAHYVFWQKLIAFLFLTGIVFLLSEALNHTSKILQDKVQYLLKYLCMKYRKTE